MSALERRRAKNDLSGLLAALADPTRRGVVDLLSEGPRRAGELAGDLDVSAPAMSKHLRVLRRQGLIEDERTEEDARVRMFRLRREPIAALQAWLAKLETFWTEQLDSYKTLAEKKRRRKRR